MKRVEELGQLWRHELQRADNPAGKGPSTLPLACSV